MPRIKKPKTHFEQVPLEVVKKIVEEEIPNEEEQDDVNVDPPTKE